MKNLHQVPSAQGQKFQQKGINWIITAVSKFNDKVNHITCMNEVQGGGLGTMQATYFDDKPYSFSIR